MGRDVSMWQVVAYVLFIGCVLQGALWLIPTVLCH